MDLARRRPGEQESKVKKIGGSAETEIGKICSGSEVHTLI